MKKALLLLFVAALAAIAQTTSTLPTYIMFGGSYNQFTGGAAFVSGIIPESSKVGLYGSATTDLVPIKFVDKKTGKTVYLISGSARAGQHKTVFTDLKNMLLVGGDFGASFSSDNTSASANVSIGLAGSFTITYVRQLSEHWAVGFPIRMLWMSGVGPGGVGAWNPVAEFGVVWKP